MHKNICKIIYFDEESITDYIQIFKGGSLEKTEQLLNDVDVSTKAGAEAHFKAGISGVFQTLIGLGMGGSAVATAAGTINTDHMAKNILKNTILTDFIDILEKDNSSENVSYIKKFDGYKIRIVKNSLSYMVMVSPYLAMLKNGSVIPAGDFGIAVEKLDNALKSAKGYYEFIATKAKSNVILRFNIDALRNNYKVNDLLKMNLAIYAICVGKSKLSDLDISNELDLDSSTFKDNPAYEKKDEMSEDDKDKEYKVYDVLLAGVEIDDR